MILLIFACVGLGMCAGGLCNEMYRRRHPYRQPDPVATLIGFRMKDEPEKVYDYPFLTGYVKTGPVPVRDPFEFPMDERDWDNNGRRVRVDPSPRPRPTNAD